MGETYHKIKGNVNPSILLTLWPCLHTLEHNVELPKEDPMQKYPRQYENIMKRYKPVIKALDGLGKAVKSAGPLNKKISELVQLAAAASIRSEGSVHSHTRRALASGAKPEEIRHAIVLLTSTIGFPTVSAALSWVDDVLERKRLI